MTVTSGTSEMMVVKVRPPAVKREAVFAKAPHQRQRGGEPGPGLARQRCGAPASRAVLSAGRRGMHCWHHKQRWTKLPPPRPPRCACSRAVAVGATLALIGLGLAWELWLAPTGSGTLAIKVHRSCCPCRACCACRLYTYRWPSLLIWLYFAEGAVRAASDRGPAAAARGARSRSALVALRGLLRCTCARACASMRARGGRARDAVSLLDDLRAAVGAAHVLVDGDLSA